MPAGMNDVRAGGAYIEIGTNEKPLGQGLASVRQRLGRFVSEMGALGKKLMIAGGILGAPLVLAIKAASDFEETLAKFKAVFKEFSEDGRSWARDLARSVGRGEGEILKFMALMQDTFVPIGIARDKAAELSLQMTKLAIDVASFNNMVDAEVINLMQSAVVGVHRAVRRFGIILSETSLKAELLRMGIEGGKDAATEAQKAQARLNLIMGASKDAIGDALRTSGSFANMMKRLRARVNDLAETVGFKLIPITKPYVKLATDLVNKFKDWAKENGVIIQTIGRVAAVLFALGATLVLVSNGLQTIWSTFKTVLVLAPIIALADALGLIPQSIKDIISEVKIGKQTLAEWTEPMRDALSTFWQAVKRTGFGIFELIRMVGDFIVRKAIEITIRLLKLLAEVIDAGIKALVTGSKKAFAGIIAGLKDEMPGQAPDEDGKSAWQRWKDERLRELAILRDGFKKTFSPDKEVFEDVVRKAQSSLRQYDDDIEKVSKKLRTVPGTFIGFRATGVAAGGVSRSLNQIAENTAQIVRNTRVMTAVAGP